MSSSRHLPKSLIAVAVSLAICPAAFAADDAANATANYDRITAKTVVVTASRTDQELLQSNSTVSVVTGKELKNLGKDSVPEMLRAEPGIKISNDGTPGSKRVSIRGENSSRTLVMIDGQRIDEQKSKSGASLLVNPYFIDRIEVVKGPASVLYGSDAIGGIVNVITKKASAQPVSLEGGVNFSSLAKGWTEWANVTGTVDRFHYAVGAFNTNTDDMYISDHTRVDNTAYDAKGFNGDFSYDITDNVTLGYVGEYFDSNSETSTTTTNVEYKNYRGVIPEWERTKHKIYVDAVNVSDVLAAIHANVFYQSTDKDFDSDPTSAVHVFVRNEQETVGGNLQLEWNLSDMFYLVTGYEGRSEKLQSYSDVDIKMGPYSAAVRIDDADYKQQTHALYTMLSTYLTDELTLNTGLRYNYIKNEPGSSVMTYNGGKAPIVQNFNYADNSDSKVVGSIGLVYQPFEYGAFRFNYSQGFRAPTVQELYLITSSGATQYGNPNLKAEESDNFEVGFRWDDGALKYDLAIFYSQADNYIETAAMGGNAQASRSFTYQNIAKANSYGAEFSLSYLIDGSFEPYANFTVMTREYETASGKSKNTGTPRFSGNAGVRYYHQYFNLDFYSNFASNSKNDDLDGTSYLGSNDFGGYATFNLAASTDFGTDEAITLYGSVENIFDRNYQTNEFIEEPGLFFTVGLKGKF